MVMSAASARSPRRANTAVTSSSTNSSGAALSLLAALTSLHVIVLHVCILLPTASALCGFDARQVVAINATLAVAICSPRVARIFRIPPSSCCSSRGTSAASRLRKRSSLIVQPGYADACCDVAFTVTATSNETTIDTGYLRIVVHHSDDDMALSFYSSLSGNLITSETASSFATMPNTTHTRMANSQSWTLSDDEALYGGGQYVNGHINYAAASLLMVQSNTEAVVPFFLSSRGYGLLWDHYGITKLNPPPPSSSSSTRQIVLDGGVALWTPPSSGDYWFYVQTCPNETDFGAQGKSFTLYLDDKLVCKHRLANMPCAVSCKVRRILTDGYDYKVHLDTDVEDPRLFFTSISDTNTTTLSSQYADYIDYYFIIGNETNATTTTPDDNGGSNGLLDLDSVIGSYREITGTAKLYEKKAYGLWQCKEHYHNQTEILEAAAKFRALSIPVDNIVQDWLYWGDLGWGPQWSPMKYPDPKGMVDTLHGLDINIMVSVWSRFDKKTKFYQDMAANGWLIDGTTYMDAWSPRACSRFFDYSREAHFDIGVDSLWLDATEPENNPHKDKQMYLGEGNAYWNTFSLEVSKAIHNGLKHYDGRRVFSLTRSSFAGQQRYGATLWSGDTTSSWDSLRRQIAMSINYQLSGIPTWSMDTGGFFRPDYQYDSPEYAQLLTRWCQFAAFTPIMRVHGASSNTELWNYGNGTMADIISGSVNLRYRLLDYVYSHFAFVEMHHYTVQRGLVLDFPHDANVHNIDDEYMFGGAFLVAPIYSPADGRDVYLPVLARGQWRNFYSGNTVQAGHHTLSGVSITEMPLFVRPSVVVMSPLRQHAFEELLSHDDVLEVRVYDGANSSSAFYQDDGMTGSPHRPYCTIRFAWNDDISSLTIQTSTGQRCEQIFSPLRMNITLVAPGHGVGVDPCADPDISLVYYGNETIVPLGADKRFAAGSIQL